MLFAEFGTGQVFWSMLWWFMFIIWIWLLIEAVRGGCVVSVRHLMGVNPDHALVFGPTGFRVEPP